MSKWTINQILHYATRFLTYHGVDSPRLSAELLIAEALNTSRINILLSSDKFLNFDELQAINLLLARRAKGEPVAYILGYKEFYGLQYIVYPTVLIPRPETEQIIDLARQVVFKDEKFYFADICTGCGNLGITLAFLFPKSLGLATDISFQAIRLAYSNACKHDVLHRMSFICSDLLSCFQESCFDLVVANPPYISESEFINISQEVSNFEPKEALVAGSIGTEKQISLIRQAKTCLRSGGWFFMELDEGQYPRLRSFIRTQIKRWSNVHLYKDLCGLPRVLAMQRV